MNYKLMLRTLGRTLQLEALCLLPPLVTALLYHEDPKPWWPCWARPCPT